MCDFLTTTTALTVSAVGAANYFLGDSQAFAVAHGQRSQAAPRPGTQALEQGKVSQSTASLHEALGSKGLVGFGMGFGAMVAVTRGVARSSKRRVARRAEKAEIDVAEKTETKPLPYFETLPPSIVSKKLLTDALSSLPKEQWDDPPEESYLYTLKCYAETYGPGKATKMGWWDYVYMKVSEPEYIWTAENEAVLQKRVDMMMSGAFPAEIPFAGRTIDSGARLQFRGEEPFAGDQIKSIVTDGRFGKQFIDNCAFYREGLKPWQRGIEIGMAHGYFIIGPFVSLGPLRNTPEAATVGLLSGVALIGLVSVGGLLFGTTIKPTLFDEKDAPKASGFQELINWHAVGGLGGAGFAHALITIFGS
jgi:photosystem I subunit 11